MNEPLIVFAGHPPRRRFLAPTPPEPNAVPVPARTVAPGAPPRPAPA